eukprot:288688-Prymnesium_polylepis.1
MALRGIRHRLYPHAASMHHGVALALSSPRPGAHLPCRGHSCFVYACPPPQMLLCVPVRAMDARDA